MDVTALRSDARRRTSVALLDDAAAPALARLLDADPIVNAVVAARVRAVGTLASHRLGGFIAGVQDGADLAAGCFSGGNLLPLGGGPDSWEAMAHFVAGRPRVCTSISGRAEAVQAMWSPLTKVWGPARTLRLVQPLLAVDVVPQVVPDYEVRAAQPQHLDRYLSAAVAMFTEELGVSPRVSPGSMAFRTRVSDLIAAGRAFARFDFRGQVMFKAEIGAVTAHTCQIQGVWVRPDLRGSGIATGGLATVLAHALALAPTASLYVNDFNVPARRLYARLGMSHVATLSTVLMP